MMLKRKSIKPLLLAAIIGISSLLGTAKVFAIPPELQEFFGTNLIVHWDPDCKPGEGAASEVIQTGTAAKSVEEFVDKYGQMAFETGKKFGIPYEAILAQAIIESGYGGSKLTQQ